MAKRRKPESKLVRQQRLFNPTDFENHEHLYFLKSMVSGKQIGWRCKICLVFKGME